MLLEQHCLYKSVGDGCEVNLLSLCCSAFFLSSSDVVMANQCCQFQLEQKQLVDSSIGLLIELFSATIFNWLIVQGWIWQLGPLEIFRNEKRN